MDSTQAAVAGASGSTITHGVQSTVTAQLGNSSQLGDTLPPGKIAQVDAYGTDILAVNQAHGYFVGEAPYSFRGGPGPDPSFNPDNAPYNVTSGSGGLLSGPAGAVTVTVGQTTTAAIGDNTNIHILPAAGGGPALLTVEAYNETIAHQKAKLDSGGAIAIAAANTDLEVGNSVTPALARVLIGPNATIVNDLGDIDIGAWTHVDLNAQSVATTYGLAGAPSGQAYANVHSATAATVGAGSLLQATYGNVVLAAGADPTGTMRSDIVAYASVNLYNNTAIPIPIPPDAQANVVSNANVTIDGVAPLSDTVPITQGILAAGDIKLLSDRGAISVTGAGTGKNIYLEALSATASAISNLFGGGPVTFDITGGSTSNTGLALATVDGLVLTGLQRDKSLSISYATAATAPPGCDVTLSLCYVVSSNGIGYTQTSYPIGTTILNEITNLEILLAQYSGDPVASGAYQSQIAFLQQKLVALGLATTSGGAVTPPALSQPSPLAVAKQQLKNLTQSLVSLGSSFDLQTTQFVTAVPVVSGAQGSNDTTLGTIVSAYGTASTASGQVATLVQSLTTYSAADPNVKAINSANASNTLLRSDLTGRKADNLTQQGYINNANSDIVAQALIVSSASSTQAQIDAARGAIQADRATILAATSQIASNNTAIGNDANAIALNLNTVNTAATALVGGADATKDKTTINAIGGQLPTVTGGASTIISQIGNTSTPDGQIASGLLAMRAQDAFGFVNLASADTSQVNSLLTTLGQFKPGDAATSSSLSTISSSTLANNALAQDINNRLAKNPTLSSQPLIDANNTQILADLATYRSNLAAIQVSQTNILNASKTAADASTVSTITSLLTPAPAYTTTASAENLAITTLTNSINGPTPPSDVPPSNPAAVAFSLGDVTAKLGTVTITGDALVGTGKILSPGNAVIGITNNTAAALLLNNLTISANQGGTITFNKVLVNNADDINALNAGGFRGSFAEVTSARSQGAALPSISITSNYDPNSKTWFDPTLLVTGPCASGSGQCQTLASGYTGTVPYYLWHPLPAPDIVVNDNKTISNPLGGVVIHSAAGDITVNGSINAGTVDVQAKNGDFVQKYVYGFDHVAGDPANVNNPAQPNPPGAGIVSNGAVYIAARYLDINGLIQSGIDQWSLALPASAVLTATDVKTVGLTDTQVSGAAADFGNILTRTPTSCATLGGAVTCTFADSSTQVLPTKYFLIPGTQNIGIALTATIGGLPVSVTYDLTLNRVEYGTDVAKQAYAANPAAKTFALVSDYGNIGATYDASLNQYDVNSMAAQGGLIQLYGQIMNTASSGATLRVLDGYAQVNVTNASSLGVVVSQLSTGQDRNGGSGGSSGNVAAGRGTAGVIDITDIQGVFGDSIGSTALYGLNATSQAAYEIHSVYTRNYDPTSGASNTVLNQTTGYLDSHGVFTANSTAAPAYGAAGNRNASYAPQSGLRYVYTTGTDQNTVYYLSYSGTQFVGSSDLRTAPTGHLDSSSGPFPTGVPTLLNGGTYLSKDGSLTGTNLQLTSFSVGNGPATFVQTDSWTDCNYWTLCIAQNYYYNVTETIPTMKEQIASLKADNPIAIQFGGVDHGTIAITSPSNILLTGTLTNLAGDTAITSANGSITAGGGADIIARNVSLSTPQGSIGAVTGAVTGPATAPVSIDLRGGSLTAAAPRGNVVVSANGNLAISQVIAGGDPAALLGRAVLTAGGSITAAAGLAAGAVEVQAPRVELTAANGAIGTAATPLVVDTAYADLTSPLRPFGDPNAPAAPVLGLYLGLSAQAQGDINIAAGTWSQNTFGDILADQVVSLGGNVTLSTPGRILDNNPVESVDTRTYDQLLNYWNKLALLADGPTGPNTLKQQATLTAYAQQQTVGYRQYWTIRDSQPDGGAVYDPAYVYVPTATETKALLAQGIDPAAYATQITTAYHALNAQVGGLTTHYVPTYTYTTADIPTSTSGQLLHGATWTVNELAIALSPGALKTVTGTNPVIKLANVSGKTVTLNAAAGIGEASRTITIDTSRPVDPATLSDAQKVALAAAERADIVFAPDGSNITILTNRPLNAAVTQALDVLVGNANHGQTYNGDAFLASLGDLKLGNIQVPGDVRIKTYGSITPAAGASFMTGSLILESADGGIGISRDPITGALVDTGFTLSPHAGATIVARAQLGVDLRVAGPALVDTIYSPGNIGLTASGDITNANGDLLVNILGTDVTLTSTNGSIGTAANALNVGNNIAGGIFAYAPMGSIYLRGPLGFLFNLDAVQAQGPVGATAAADMTVSGAVTGAGGITLVAGQQLTVGAAGRITPAVGDATLDAGAVQILDGGTVSAALGHVIIDAGLGDAVVTGLSSGLAAADAIQITATGRILSGTGSPADITDALGGVILRAGTGIGTATVDDTAALAGLIGSPDLGMLVNPLRLQVAAADARTSAGDLDLSTVGPVSGGSVVADNGTIAIAAMDALHLNSLSAPRGSVMVSGAAGLTLDSITAGSDPSAPSGGISVTTSGGAILVDHASGGGDVTIRSATTATVTSLSSTGGAATVEGAGLVTLGMATTATGLIVASAADAVILGSAASGGPVGMTAAGDIGFTAITTTGSISSVTLTSRTGAIIGGSIDAGGGVALAAAGPISGDRIMAGGGVSIGSGGSEGWTSINAGGAVQLTATGGIGFTAITTTGGASSVMATSRTGTITGGTIDAGGDVALQAAGSTSGDRITAGGGVSVGSGGNEGWTTINGAGAVQLTAAGSIVFTGITTTGGASSVMATSGTGTITGGAIGAGGSVALQAPGSITGDRITAAGGVVIGSGGTVAWNTILSGGTQQITASGDIRVGSLTTAGMVDPPDIDLISTGGQIVAGSLSSIGSVNVSAATDVTIGSIVAADQVNLQAMTGTVTVDGIRSGGTATLDAGASAIFTTIATTGTPSDRGSVIIRAGSGPVQGQTLTAAGDVTLSGNGIFLGTLQAGGNGDIASRGDVVAALISVGGALRLAGDPAHRFDIAEIDAASVSATGADTITLPKLKVGGSLSLGARVIDITAEQVPPSEPLLLDVGGLSGAPAQAVTLQIDSPSGLTIGSFAAVDATINTTAVNVSMAQAYIPGSLVVQTPIDTLLVDNRSPVPGRSPDQQLFQPGGRFYFTLRDKGLITDAYVVEYHSGSQITNILNGNPYRGASLVRDELRIYRNGQFDPISPDDPVLRYGPLATLAEEIAATDGSLMPDLIALPADGHPAVNLVGPMP